jgi:hypothetical protein
MLPFFISRTKRLTLRHCGAYFGNLQKITKPKIHLTGAAIRGILTGQQAEAARFSPGDERQPGFTAGFPVQRGARANGSPAHRVTAKRDTLIQSGWVHPLFLFLQEVRRYQHGSDD